MAGLIERLRAAYHPLRAEDFQPVQINTIVENVHTLSAAHLRSRQIHFEFQADRGLPAIPGLADPLRQVVLNLILNAADAMPSGGRLVVRTQTLAERDEILLSVQDSGSGIDPEILPHIFEPFITSKETGTGLGLSIVQRLVETFEGMISVQSAEAQGTTFTVTLPIAAS